MQGKVGHWHTTLGEEGLEDGKVLNDRVRIVAGAELWRHDNDISIVVMGGLGKMEGLLPQGLTLAGIMKEELLQLGVPTHNILEENRTSSTYEQIRTVGKMLKSGELLGGVSIMSNRYHLPRIRALIDHSKLRDLFEGKRVELVGAEDVLLRYKKEEWGDFIEITERSEGMKKRKESETQGVADIKNGSYKFSWNRQNE